MANVFSKLKKWLKGTNSKYQTSTATSKKYYQKVATNSSSKSDISKTLKEQKKKEAEKKKQLTNAFKAKENAVTKTQDSKPTVNNNGTDRVLSKVQKKAVAPKPIKAKFNGAESKFAQSMRKETGLSNRELMLQNKLGTNQDVKAAELKTLANKKTLYPIMMGATNQFRGKDLAAKYGNNKLAQQIAENESNYGKFMSDSQIGRAYKNFATSPKGLGTGMTRDDFASSNIIQNGQKTLEGAGQLAGDLGLFMATGGVANAVGSKAMSKIAPNIVNNVAKRGAVQKLAAKKGVDAITIAESLVKGISTDLGVNLTSGMGISALDAAITSDGDLTQFGKDLLKNTGINMALGGLTEVGLAGARSATKYIEDAYGVAVDTLRDKNGFINFGADGDFYDIIDYSKFMSPDEILKDSASRKTLLANKFFDKYKTEDEALDAIKKIWLEKNLNDTSAIRQISLAEANERAATLKRDPNSEAWFSMKEVNDAKPKIVERIAYDQEGRNASLNKIWRDYLQVAKDPAAFGAPLETAKHKGISYEDFLNTDVTLFRGISNKTSKSGDTISNDIYQAWTPDKVTAEGFAKGTGWESVLKSPIGKEAPVKEIAESPMGNGNMVLHKYSDGSMVVEMKIKPRDLIAGRISGVIEEMEVFSQNPTAKEAAFTITDSLKGNNDPTYRVVGEPRTTMPSEAELNAKNPYYIDGAFKVEGSLDHPVNFPLLNRIAAKYTGGEGKDLLFKNGDIISSDGKILIKGGENAINANDYARETGFSCKGLTDPNAESFIQELSPREFDYYANELDSLLTDKDKKFLKDMQYEGQLKNYSAEERADVAKKELTAELKVLERKRRMALRDVDLAQADFIDDNIFPIEERIKVLDNGVSVEEMLDLEDYGMSADEIIELKNMEKLEAKKALEVKAQTQQKLDDAAISNKEKKLSEIENDREFLSNEISETFGQKFYDESLDSEQLLQLKKDWERARDEYDGYDYFDFADDYDEYFAAPKTSTNSTPAYEELENIIKTSNDPAEIQKAVEEMQKVSGTSQNAVKEIPDYDLEELFALSFDDFDNPKVLAEEVKMWKKNIEGGYVTEDNFKKAALNHIENSNNNAQIKNEVETLYKKVTGKDLNATVKKTPPKSTPSKVEENTTAEFASVTDNAEDIGITEEGELAQQAQEKALKALDESSSKSNPFLNEVHKGVNKSNVKSELKQNYQQDGLKVKTGKGIKKAAANLNTKDAKVKSGFITITTGTGQKGVEGDVLKKLKSGDVTIKRYKDAENYQAGATRILKKFTNKNGTANTKAIENYIDGTLRKYAKGDLKLSSKELRDSMYDWIACIDIANANTNNGKNSKLYKDLYLAACEALSEDVSVGALGMRQFQKIAMSNPTYRAEAVEKQIMNIFNKSKGFLSSSEYSKFLTDGKIDSKGFKEFVESNPKLKRALEAIQESDTVGDVQKNASKAILEARKMIPMTRFDQLTQWRYVAMLSSPTTHVKNIVSNIYTGVMDGLSSGITKEIQDSLIKNGKVPEGYYRSTSGVSVKAFKQSHDGAISNYLAQSKVDSLQMKLDAARDELADAVSTSDAKAVKDRIESLTKQLDDAVKNANETMSKNIPKSDEMKAAKERWYGKDKNELVSSAEKYEMKYASGVKSKGAGRIVSKASKFINEALHTSDAISIEARYCENYYKTLKANGYGKLKSLANAGNDDAKVALEKLEEYASQHASYRALTETYNNYNAFAKWANKTLSKTLYNVDAKWYQKAGGFLLNATMPFLKIPANVATKTFTYSPIGLIRGKAALEKAIKAGDSVAINEATEKMGQGALGSAIAFLGVGLGFIDPDAMTITTRLQDDDVDKLKKNAGYQDYALQALGKSFTLEWLSPTSGSFFTGVEIGRGLRNIIDNVKGDDFDIDISEIIEFPMVAASRLIEPALQMTMFQGVNNTIENVIDSSKYSKTNINPVLKIGESAARNYVTSMYPSISKKISKVISPYDYFVSGDTDLEYALLSLGATSPAITTANNMLGKPLYGAKTNTHGEVINKKNTAGDYAKSFAKNMISPSNIKDVTWGDVDEELVRINKATGKTTIFPKNMYDESITFGRNSSTATTFEMSNKDKSDYNVAKGKSGETAMASALESVIFNRYDKDGDGKRTILTDGYTKDQKEKLIAKFNGKGAKDVAEWVIKQPQYKLATEAERIKVINMIYGNDTGYGNDDEYTSQGAKQYSEKVVAKKKGMSEAEYDYKNEVPASAQAILDKAISKGELTYKEAVDFCRNAGKTYYYTDEKKETGGKKQTYYNKTEMIAYLQKKGYSYKKAEALYNAFKNNNAKSYNGSSSSRSSVYGRRYSSSSSRKIPVSSANKSAYKASKPSIKMATTTSKGTSSLAQALENMNKAGAKITPPKNKE